MRWLTGLFLVWRHACRQALRGRRVAALVCLALLPVLLAWLQVQVGQGVTHASLLGTLLMGVLQFVVPFAALFLGVAVLGDEIEGRTITYLFTRPLPRQIYFLGRYLGYATAFTLLLAPCVAATCWLFGTRVELSAAEIAGSVAVAVGGLLVYMAFLAALRAFFDRALFLGFFLGFIVEGMISKLPASGLSRCSVWHHLALLQTRLFSAGQGGVRDLLEGIDPAETTGGSLTVLAVVWVASLALGMWKVRAHEIRVSAATA